MVPLQPPTPPSEPSPGTLRGFDPWRETSRNSILILLISVFLLFTTVGFTNDIMALGRLPALRFALAVILSGGFAIVYAIAAISLLGRSWKAILPLLVLQIAVMGLLVKWQPNLPLPVPMDAAQLGRVRVRMILDSVAILTAVSLGYAGFFQVAVKEALRYVKPAPKSRARERICSGPPGPAGHSAGRPSLHSRLRGRVRLQTGAGGRRRFL